MMKKFILKIFDTNKEIKIKIDASNLFIKTRRQVTFNDISLKKVYVNKAKLRHS